MYFFEGGGYLLLPAPVKAPAAYLTNTLHFVKVSGLVSQVCLWQFDTVEHIHILHMSYVPYRLVEMNDLFYRYAELYPMRHRC